jgi:hypothetical protein
MEPHALRRLVTSRRAWLAVAALAVGALLVDVTIVRPLVHVRWRDGVTGQERMALEQRYRLHDGERLDATTWRYELRDGSTQNVGALVQDPAVEDTAYIDRDALTAPDPTIAFRLDRARRLFGPKPFALVQPQSVVLVAAGGVMLWAAAIADGRRRRTIALAALLAVGAAAYTFPLRQPIRMGDSETYTQSRQQFEEYTGVRQIRYEAHLSHAILGRLDAMFGRTDASPSRALHTLMHGATAWFLAMALVVGFVEAWSPVVVRYLALAVIAPSALMYFGYLELGHLSLNLAAFPLLIRGLTTGTRHLEAGSALAGFGAALHGFGLLSIAGAVLAATRGRNGDPVPYPLAMAARILRILGWSVAAYVGWIAIYMIVLKLPVMPGHADAIPIRPWLADEVGDRVNAAILSARGVRDVAATLFLVGMPLIAIAASLRRRLRVETDAALLYAVPSAAFVVLFWPVQGLAVELDLLFAAFPAVYALAWVCAHDARRAAIAALILALGHLVFWRIALDSAFVNSRL